MFTCAPRGHFGLFSSVANEAARLQEVLQAWTGLMEIKQESPWCVSFCCQRGQHCDLRPVLWAVSPFESVHWLAACSSATVPLDTGTLRALVRSVHGGEINPGCLVCAQYLFEWNSWAFFFFLYVTVYSSFSKKRVLSVHPILTESAPNWLWTTDVSDFPLNPVLSGFFLWHQGN